ncbi:MAG: hypothetical protein WC337_02860 [Candidatus Muiribacteriota bacterium]
MNKLGSLYKEAEQWREIQRSLPDIIKLSNMPRKDLYRLAGISSSHFNHILKDTKRLKPKHYAALFRIIVEDGNFLRLKQRSPEL